MSRRRLGFRLMALTLLPVLLLATGGVLSQSLLAEPGNYQEAIFEDSESHAGPGPHPTTESNHFKLVNGAIKWFDTGEVVEYRLVGIPSQFAEAVEDAIATLDAAITTRSFVRNDATSQLNPCTGQPNTVSWISVDGDGGVLAAAAACFNTMTKEIKGFRMAFDAGDTWSMNGAAGAFDIQNVGTHEMGHVAGLGHVNGAKDGCLTMYKFSDRGETQKRTLGWGDSRGLDRLYGSSEPGEGQACGN